MCTVQKTRAARYTFAALVHVEALIEAHAAENARLATRHLLGYPVTGWPEWTARSAELNAERRRLEAELRPLLCAKCNGTGVTQWRNRFGGVCFSCRGDGWSAQGRRNVRGEL